MLRRFLAAGALLATLSLGHEAHAVYFSFNGAGISGSGYLTAQWDTIPNDPVGAFNVTAASGTFSDTNIGISNWQITGVIPTNPNPSNYPFATSLSYYPASGPVLPPVDAGALSYDDLLYLGPSGAPDTCFDGITGGFVDVFGILFAIGSPDGSQTGAVDLWSDGGGPNVSPMYGAAVVDMNGVAIDYQDPETAPFPPGITMFVPEPSSIALLASFLGGVAAMRLRPTKRRTVVVAER
jgi:hypothetical protein